MSHPLLLNIAALTVRVGRDHHITTCTLSTLYSLRPGAAGLALNVECVQNMKFYLRSAAAASLPRSLFSLSQYLQLGISHFSHL